VHFRTTGELVELSQQELIDCSWAYQNYGCDGGEDFQAYQCAVLSPSSPAGFRY
jgi:hypothetical protein